MLDQPDQTDGRMPSWSTEQKEFSITADVKCSFCGGTMTITRQSTRTGNNIESEREVMGNILAQAQSLHSDCVIKAKANTVFIQKHKRS